ncbi:hypothetical protein Y032_0032g2567 [Ancylostoma ceylanicum]|uniref:Uncharacterized protein n=1 Tax=Ancylostoma ceylanicum TaxID=53326 RepID=A0A016UQZ0_9BILA|nr:hypothetical protein Y032_0032g2567 [Ancylostoma ceylanicum]
MEEGSATADSILATYAFLMKLNNSTAHGKNSLDFVNRHAVVIFRWTITPLACNHQHWQGVILFADIGNVLFSVGRNRNAAGKKRLEAIYCRANRRQRHFYYVQLPSLKIRQSFSRRYWC